jgi:type II secretory pathway pseudopilin PulG
MGIGRPRISLSRLRKEEGGWLIVEMMIGAVVLIIGGLAIYNGLDGASKASGRNRNRTEASILAQQDQERMRTMDATALSNYHRVATVQVGKLAYVVTSNAAYVSDTSGAVSCTNSSTTAQYLKISSSVADPTNVNQPVVEDSLLSPKPADAGAAVQIIDRNGTGVSGIPISLAEPPSTSVTTDSQGCALFGFLDTSTDYGVTFSKIGYVDPSGQKQFTDAPITQVPGSTTLTQFQYDLAGSVTANIVTAPVIGTGGPTAAAATTLSAFDTHIPGAQFRTFPISGNSVTANNLFPFTDAYTFFAGNCLTQKPPATSTKIATATVTPGSTSQVVSVTEPAVKISTGSSGAQVWLRSSDDGCSDSYGPITADTNGVVWQGFPYGNYRVCVKTGSGFNTRYGWDDVDNTGDSGMSDSITASTSSFSRDTDYCP